MLFNKRNQLTKQLRTKLDFSKTQPLPTPELPLLETLQVTLPRMTIGKSSRRRKTT